MSVNFRMNSWSHPFSQNTNKKLSGFLLSVVRNPDSFSFVLWEKWWLNKFILKLTDLYYYENAHTTKLTFLLFSFPFPFSISVLDVVKNRRNSPRWSMPRLRWKRCDTLSLSWFQRQPILDLWPPGNYLFNYLGEIKNSLWSVVFHWMFKSRPSRTESRLSRYVSRFLCPLGGQKKAFDHPMELNLGTE